MFLLQQPFTLQDYIGGKLKKNSPIMTLCQKLFTPGEARKKSKSMLSRISTKKFSEYWETLKKIQQNESDTEAPKSSDFADRLEQSEFSPQKSSCDMKFKSFACFEIEKSRILDPSNKILSNDREWTFNLYNYVTFLPCLVRVTGKNLSKTKLDIYSECKFPDCPVKSGLDAVSPFRRAHGERHGENGELPCRAEI